VHALHGTADGGVRYPAVTEDVQSRGVTLSNTISDPLAQAGTSMIHEVSRSGDELAAGSRIDRYIVLQCQGRGGMGIVYSAYDPKLDRKVALKLLHDSDLSDRRRDRLVREARVLAQLAHPNIVVVFDVDNFADHLFLTMELVAGPTLRAWLRQPRAWRDVVRVFLEGGRGLAAAHAAHVIHRDFKPENVLLGFDGRARVADFGLARSIADASNDGSAGGSASGLGTPGYRSPEQKAGGQVDARSDQYSFCVALFEGLHGRRPDETRGASEVRAPAHLRRVLERGLCAAPAERYPTMVELLADLARDPRAARLRVAAVAIPVVAAVGLTTMLRGPDQPEPCRGGAQKLAGVWDDTTRRAGRAAFAATQKPFAAAAWGYVERTLDRGGAAWVEQWTQACEATRVRGEQSEELLDLRMDCLDARRLEIKALVDQLTRADEELVKNASKETQSVIDFDQCRHTDALRQVVRPPRDAVMRIRLGAVRMLLAEGAALRSAGKYGKAVAQARTALAEARELHYAPIEADAQLLLALAQEQANEYPAAVAGLLEAVAQAEAARDDHTRARGLIGLVRVLARMARYDEAQGYDKLAEAAVGRAGGGDELHALVLAARLQLRKQRGRNNEALALSEQLVALREREAEAHPDLLAAALVSLGDSYRLVGRHDESIAVTRRARDIFERVLGEAHPFTAQAINNIGAAYGASNQLAEALPYFERALAIREAAFGPDHPTVAVSSENVGTALAQLGQLDRALPLVERALSIEENRHGSMHPAVATSLWSLASVQLRRGDAAAARSAGRRALAIYEAKHVLDHRDVADASQLVAEAELALGHAAVALPLAERANAIYERQPKLRVELAQTRFTLARALGANGRDLARARKLAIAARDVFAADGEPLRKNLHDAESWLRDHGTRAR
jgi:tetratricopeptide (TPR) repeat protein